VLIGAAAGMPAALASAIPARRVSKADPMVGLRQD
jgi:hypothetical protein